MHHDIHKNKKMVQTGTCILASHASEVLLMTTCERSIAKKDKLRQHEHFSHNKAQTSFFVARVVAMSPVCLQSNFGATRESWHQIPCGGLHGNGRAKQPQPVENADQFIVSWLEVAPRDVQRSCPLHSSLLERET